MICHKRFSKKSDWASFLRTYTGDHLLYFTSNLPKKYYLILEVTSYSSHYFVVLLATRKKAMWDFQWWALKQYLMKMHGESHLRDIIMSIQYMTLVVTDDNDRLRVAFFCRHRLFCQTRPRFREILIPSPTKTRRWDGIATHAERFAQLQNWSERAIFFLLQWTNRNALFFLWFRRFFCT